MRVQQITFHTCCSNVLLVAVILVVRTAHHVPGGVHHVTVAQTELPPSIDMGWIDGQRASVVLLRGGVVVFRQS